jgi:hypothetical protein
MRKIDVRRPVRARTRRKDDSIGPEAVPRAVDGRNLDAVLIHERCPAADHVHVIALVESAAQLDLAANHLFGFSHEVAVVRLRSAFVGGQLLDGVAQRLAGNRSTVGT